MSKFHTFTAAPRPKYLSRGFSLIEFLVASALSAIVLMAVTSTYFTARNLNSTAGARLGVQQELRNASALIVRDARMAGSFGCFNMAKHPRTAVLNDSAANSVFSLASAGVTNLLPVRETGPLGISGFTQNGNALLFQYGIDNTSNTPLSPQVAIASNCSNISKPGTAIDNTAAARQALRITDTRDDGRIAILRHTVNAYAVGQFNADSQGLYRFQLADNGGWGDPQLLIKNVSAMAIRYLYVTPNTCPEGISASEPDNTTYHYAAEFDATAPAESPAMVQLTLNNGNIDASADNRVHAYTINATVRGGNTCADRSI